MCSVNDLPFLTIIPSMSHTKCMLQPVWLSMVIHHMYSLFKVFRIIIFHGARIENHRIYQLENIRSIF